MGRKKDLGEVDAVAAHYGMDGARRRLFGKYLEACKAEGECGSKNTRGDFTWEELAAKAVEFLETQK